MNQQLDYPVGTKLMLTKISASAHPVTEPGSWDQWIPGGDNPASLPVDYTLNGFLLKPIEIGSPIIVLQTERNGVQAIGLFRSTPVIEYRKPAIAGTFNSLYKITTL